MGERLLERAPNVADVLVKIDHRSGRDNGTLPLPLPMIDQTLAQLGARVMLEQLERIARHEPGTRRGDDPEELHKMRVATRRLRVACAVFAKSLAREGISDLPVTETKALAAALGEVRDQDVFLEWLAEQGAARSPGSVEAVAVLRLRDERLERRETARRALLVALDGPDRAALGQDLAARLGAVAEREGRPKKKRRVSRAGPVLIARARRRLKKRAAALFAPTQEELHEVRIAAKRYRYVCEFLSPALPDAAADLAARIETATAVQDALGELHDAHVAEAALLDDAILAGTNGESRAAAGIAALARAQRSRAHEALIQFREAWRQLV
jgi:CHAD domain-containing protein